MPDHIAWAACGFFAIPGALCILVSYGAMLASRREGRHISGVPLFGGVLVALGFLLSPCKWLALLGLLDYGVWMVGWSIVSDILHLPRRDARPDPAPPNAHEPAPPHDSEGDGGED